MSGQNEEADRIEREIQDSRERIDATLAALGEEISPGQLLDRALGYTRRHGGAFADNLVGTVSRNPVPALLTSIGLAWLAAGNDPTAPRRGSAYDTRGSRVDRVRAKASAYADRAREGMGGARDGAADAATRVREEADAATRQAGTALRGAGDQLESLHENHPLVMGGLAFALGAALGGTTPNSLREDEWLGPHGERARARVAEHASAGAERVEEKTREEAHRAAEQVHAREGAGPQGP